VRLIQLTTCVLKSYAMGRVAPGQAQLLYCELSLTIGGIVFVIKDIEHAKWRATNESLPVAGIVYCERHCTPRRIVVSSTGLRYKGIIHNGGIPKLVH